MYMASDKSIDFFCIGLYNIEHNNFFKSKAFERREKKTKKRTEKRRSVQDAGKYLFFIHFARLRTEIIYESMLRRSATVIPRSNIHNFRFILGSIFI